MTKGNFPLVIKIKSSYMLLLQNLLKALLTSISKFFQTESYVNSHQCYINVRISYKLSLSHSDSFVDNIHFIHKGNQESIFVW
jgi:hypothetical protein